MKRLLSKVVTDLDPIKRMNFVSSVLRKSQKFMDFRLSSANATVKPNSVFIPYTREEILKGAGEKALTANGLLLSMVLKKLQWK